MASMAVKQDIKPVKEDLSNEKDKARLTQELASLKVQYVRNVIAVMISERLNGSATKGDPNIQRAKSTIFPYKGYSEDKINEKSEEVSNKMHELSYDLEEPTYEYRCPDEETKKQADFKFK